MSLDIDKERAAFEATYDAFEFRKEYDKYGPTEAAYSIWRAARTTPAPTPAAAEGQAEALGYIRSNARSQLLVGGSLLTAITRHPIATDDVAIFAAPLPRQAAVQEAPLDNKVIAINRDSLMQIAKRLISERLPDCDEEFMAARAHGIGSLHAEILMAAQQGAPVTTEEGKS